MIAFVPPRVCLDVTTCGICLRGPSVLALHLPSLYAMFICFPCLLCATRLAFFASMLPYYMLVYMFMHESMSYTLQFSGAMDIRYKPKFVLLGHRLLFENMLFAFPYAQHALFALVWLSLVVCSLHALPMSFVRFFACLLACFFCLCMHTYRARIHGARVARVQLPRREQKGQGCKQKDANPQRVMISRLRGLAHPKWSLLSLYLSLLSKACIGVPILVPHFIFLLFVWVAFPRYGNVRFTFLVPCQALPLECWQCLVYFSTLCDSIVNDGCYIYIYIYLPTCV